MAAAAGSDGAKPIVAVTGGSGYIAGHVIHQLLEKGYTVHATVRSLANEAKVKHLQDQFPGVKLFEADLLAEGSFDACFEGATYVLHTASPFQLTVSDPQRDLVDPALKGTLNAMASAKKAGVKRVVVTSSCAAVTSQVTPEDVSYVWTEKDWNTDSTLTAGPYRMSKSVAERAAWDFVEAAQKEGAELSMVACCPSFVLGPAFSTRTDGESAKFCVKALDGSFVETGVPNSAFGCVDVRDVARAHVAAMETEAAAGNRYILSSEAGISKLELVNHLRESDAFKDWPLPTKEAAPVGYRPLYSHAKAEAELGIEFTPISKSIVDMAQSFVAAGIVKRPEA